MVENVSWYTLAAVFLCVKFLQKFTALSIIILDMCKIRKLRYTGYLVLL